MNAKGKQKRRSKSGSKPLGSISSRSRPTEDVPIDHSLIPLDTLMVKIYSLQLTDENPYKQFNIKICFMNQIICNTTIASISAREKDCNSSIAEGFMYFDPSDHEKMSMISDYPMTVHIYPASNKKLSLPTTTLGEVVDEDETMNIKKSDLINKVVLDKEVANISCCNIDVLPLFTEKDRILVRKRLEPMVKRSALNTKSWCNLPVICMEVSMILDHSNEPYHRLYHQANHMTVTLVGAYNLGVEFSEELQYVAATKIAQGNAKNSATITFEQGEEKPKLFSSIEFYPHWECLRCNDDVFTTSDEKWLCKNGLHDIQNNDNLNLNYYLNEVPSNDSVIWRSFHRALMMKSTEEWLQEHIRRWQWPLEIHVNNGEQSIKYMAFLDLFKLLYPGENTVRVAVPLQWWSFSDMMEACDCPPLLPTNDKTFDKYNDKVSSFLKSSTRKTDDTDITTTEDTVMQTGADGNPAFVIIEVKLARPLVEVKVPQLVHNTEIDDMLLEIENDMGRNRPFTGRGQLDQNWQRTVLSAVAALKKVPYHGAQDIIFFIRQLAQNRVKLEVFTSFWQEAAVYVNNNFVVSRCLESETQYQEMLTAAFSCMMQLTVDTVFGHKPNSSQSIDPVLRAARHARQMQDREHAKNLYLYLVSRNADNADYWREFGNTMKHYKKNWSRICIDKAVYLNPRHPLTLIAKGCMAGDDEAEIFFDAVLALYPFWYTGWVIVSTYYWQRGMYEMADAFLSHVKDMERDQMHQEICIDRTWEQELGDWWDHTPILPGMNVFYDATDMLLRIRAITLAKACIARAFLDSGETAQYYHLLALCCRLSGNTKDALCHVTEAINKYGEISYLRTLQGECYHILKEITPAMAAFEKAGTCAEAYSLLLSMPCREVQRARSYLVDLVRRYPCSYTWMGLADDWIMRSSNQNEDPDSKVQENVTARACAAACAIQALKWDRLCARAWALLSLIVPVPTRRAYYSQMAEKCGYVWKRKEVRIHHNLLNRPENECHRVATALLECRCRMCYEVKQSCK